MENALCFSSQLRNRQFIPLLNHIKKNIDKIINICPISHNYIDIQNYINEKESDDLSQIKELIEYIINSEKSSSKNSFHLILKYGFNILKRKI